MQFAGGLALMLIPSAADRGWLILAEGWLLLACMILIFLRPVFFNRGFADFVMGVCSSAYYALLSWAVNSPDIGAVGNFRTFLCIGLFFTGVAKILTFAGLLDSAALWFLLLEGIVEILSAFLLIFKFPSSQPFVLYLFCGFLLAVEGFESMAESHVLSRFAGKLN